jgi:hypothetical protein
VHPWESYNHTAATTFAPLTQSGRAAELHPTRSEPRLLVPRSPDGPRPCQEIPLRSFGPIRYESDRIPAWSRHMKRSLQTGQFAILGKAVDQAMKSRGLTNVALAERLKYHESTVRHVRRGEKAKSDTYSKVCEHLGIEMAKLLDGAATVDEVEKSGRSYLTQRNKPRRWCFTCFSWFVYSPSGPALRGQLHHRKDEVCPASSPQGLSD